MHTHTHTYTYMHIHRQTGTHANAGFPAAAPRTRGWGRPGRAEASRAPTQQMPGARPAPPSVTTVCKGPFGIQTTRAPLCSRTKPRPLPQPAAGRPLPVSARKRTDDPFPPRAKRRLLRGFGSARSRPPASTPGGVFFRTHGLSCVKAIISGCRRLSNFSPFELEGAGPSPEPV